MSNVFIIPFYSEHKVLRRLRLLPMWWPGAQAASATVTCVLRPHTTQISDLFWYVTSYLSPAQATMSGQRTETADANRLT